MRAPHPCGRRTPGLTKLCFVRWPTVHRRCLRACLAGLLLLAQLSMAAYACPRLAAPVSAITQAATQAAAMADMPGCTGDMAAMDLDQPLLCKAHCEAGLQSLNSGAALADAPPAVALPAALLVVLDVAQAAERAAAMPPGLPTGPPAGTPPLYLSLLVLRN